MVRDDASAGRRKCSGRAKYTADIVAPGQLAGRIYRSPYSHAEIR